MYEPISAKQFRENMQQVLEEVHSRKKRYTLIYRSSPMVNIVPPSFSSQKKSKEDEGSYAENIAFRRAIESNIGNTANRVPIKLEEEKRILRERLKGKYGL